MTQSHRIFITSDLVFLKAKKKEIQSWCFRKGWIKEGK